MNQSTYNVVESTNIPACFAVKVKLPENLPETLLASTVSTCNKNQLINHCYANGTEYSHVMQLIFNSKWALKLKVALGY